MGKARNSLDPNKPQFSQVELCEVAEIPMATANNWILTGALRPADVGSRRARKPRLFSVVTIFVVVHPTKRADLSRHGYRAANSRTRLRVFLPPKPNIRTLKRGGGEKT
jgi:hypothetical protein